VDRRAERKKNQAKRPPDLTRVTQNRRARHDYEVLETYEAGLQLTGSEVKSLREGRAQIRDAYGRIEDGEAWIVGMHIPPYSHAVGFGAHNPERRRKLLLHRGEIDRLAGKLTQQGLTLIPLSVYFRNGYAKVELALAKGRRLWDRRAATAERDARRELERAIKAARHA